jgi:hypothetical protein
MVNRRPRRSITFFGAFVVFVLLLVALVLPPAPREIVLTRDEDPRVIAGALHIHTVRSDGGGTIEDVAAAAARAGLSFVVTTDHGDGRGLIPPAYRSGVLCLSGAEISTDDGHIVAVGLRTPEYRLAGEGRDVIDDIHRLGGMAIVAHPVSSRRELGWRDWDARFDGIEWLNADTEWRDESVLALVRLAAGYPLRPSAALATTFDRPVEALARFDAVSAGRSLVAIAGHDAHARIGPRRGDRYEPGVSLPLPGYEAAFRTFSVRAILDADLTGEAEADAAVVLRALRHGRVYTAIDAIARPARISFVAHSGGATAEIGGRVIPAGPLVFEIEADGPADAALVLIHEGKEIASGPPPSLRRELPAVPGAYRAEVRLSGAPGDPPVPWVMTSTIHVGIPSDVSPVELALASVPPLPVSVSSAPWQVEHAPGSQAVIAPAGPDLVQMNYHLDALASGSPYAALTWPLQVPAEARALRFTAQSDRPMRISVQMRMPGGTGGVRWRRSVYVDTVERELAIDLADFRPVEPETPAEFDPAHMTALLFVIDTVNTDPGAEGWVRVGRVTLR